VTTAGAHRPSEARAGASGPSGVGAGADVGVLAVVCVLYESGHQHRQFVEALQRTHPGLHVLLVDNGSYDAVDRADLPDGVDLLTLPRNRGYGQAVNAGIAHLLQHQAPEFVAILNPDVFLAGPSLRELATFMSAHPRCALATGTVVDGAGSVVSSAWGPPSMGRAFWYASGLSADGLRRALTAFNPTGRESLESRRDMPFPVSGHVLGGAMVARVAAMQEVGGFSDRFFLYWEDADLADRLRQAGHEVWFVPTSPIRHEAGTSSAGTTDAFRRLWYAHSARLYAEDHLSARRARRLRLGLKMGDTVRHLRRLGHG